MSGYERLWSWFGLSRASFLVIPRVLMHEMPDEWQMKMSELLEEYDNAYDTSGVCDSVNVSCKICGKFSKLPEWVTNYRRPSKEDIAKVKKST
ncbi:MAG: hypothetical protein ACRCXB_14370 [Aeromonadaceae bacterium]